MNVWKSSPTTRRMRLRWMAVPLRNGAGNSSISMKKPMTIAIIWRTGASTITAMNGSVLFAGLGNESAPRSPKESAKDALETSGVAECGGEEVKEELAVEDPPVAGPDGVCTPSPCQPPYTATSSGPPGRDAQTLAVIETRRDQSCQMRLPIADGM
jgi:hypothetical protein